MAPGSAEQVCVSQIIASRPILLMNAVSRKVGLGNERISEHRMQCPTPRNLAWAMSACQNIATHRAQDMSCQSML